MGTQIGLTLVPEVLHPTGAKDILVIGLGSGVSVGAALSPDSVQHIDVVEMSPEVVAASKEFAPFNALTYTSGSNVTLNTPKVQLIINDARNHLLLTTRKYDVISSEPSNPWMAGIGNLFTQEAFEMARGHLKPGGIMCQWVHSYRLDQRDFFSIIRTFLDVFQHVQFWNVNGGDFLLIGSDQPLVQPLGRLQERLKQPAINAWLKKVHYDTEPQFLACYLGDEEFFLDPMTAKSQVHTDDNMLLEFSAPRSLYVTGKSLKASMMIPVPEEMLDYENLNADERRRWAQDLDRAVSAREHARYANEGTGSVADHLTVARTLAPYQLWPAQVIETPPVTADELATIDQRAEAMGKQGKWFDVAEILRQRCALSPLDIPAKRKLFESFMQFASMLKNRPANCIYLLRCARRIGNEIDALGGGSKETERSARELDAVEKK
jgi:hypothetical protein